MPNVLIVVHSFVDDRHVLQIVNVGALHNEDSTADLQDVSYSQRMQRTLLTFRAESKPSAIS